MHPPVDQLNCQHQRIIVGKVYPPRILLSECYRVIFPLETFRGSLLQTHDAGGRTSPSLPCISILPLPRVSPKSWTSKNGSDLPLYFWGSPLRLGCHRLVLWLWPLPPDITAHVSPADELLNFFLQMDTLCRGVTDILVVLAVSTGVPFGPILSHGWGFF